jgi:quinol monooxygenase YgiN
MNAFVVTVDFGPEPGTAAAFRKFIDENAQNVMGAQNRVRVTRRARVHGANDRIFLYELCGSRTAFPSHLPSPHFAAFNKTSGDLAMNETVAKLILSFEGSNIRR